jgi:hypothetical protein
MLTVTSSTCQEHTETVPATKDTEAVRESLLPVGIDINDAGGVVIEITGTGCAETVTVALPVVDLEYPSDTVNVTMEDVPTAALPTGVITNLLVRIVEDDKVKILAHV